MDDFPLKPAELAETKLLDAILSGRFPINATLPPERELAEQLHVTRPTLREALQRLGRDGWVEIRHGKPTRVRDYWREGNLAVLGAIARHSENLPDDFVPNLLEMRILLAPAYTVLAVENSPEKLIELVSTYPTLADTSEAFANADWMLHHTLTIESGNPIFTLILNGLDKLYHDMAKKYFAMPQARVRSRQFYLDLLDAIKAGDSLLAEKIVRDVSKDSLFLWHELDKLK
jgi:GntR family transcriptional regulator, negative regulator for fad regulon and positive regulator of fabA